MLRRLSPATGQESVWDYPRPPRVEETSREIRVVYEDIEIAASVRSLRVLETYGAPVYYLPPADVAVGLRSIRRSTVCEWKGRAAYFDLVCGSEVIKAAAWTYPEPAAEYAAISGYYAFFPDLVDCYVDGERAAAQPGGFYGGWVTGEIVGPMKGEPGTAYW